MKKYLSIGLVLIFALSAVLTSFFIPAGNVSADAPTTIFSDGFGTGSTDSTFNESPTWNEYGNGAEKRASGSGNDIASPDSGRFAVVFGGAGSNDGKLCRTIDTTGYNSVQLSYYWLGDTDADNSGDNAIVEFKSASGGAACSNTTGWTTLANHDLTNDSSWTTQGGISNSGFNNTSFLLKFRASSGDNENFRLDGVLITGIPIDNTPPTISSIVMDDTDFKIGDTAQVDVTFSEAVTGFDNSDITTIDNGTLTPVSSSDGGVTWSAVFTPTNAIEVLADPFGIPPKNLIVVTLTGLTDLAGNPGVGTERSNYYSIDTLAPVLSLPTIAPIEATGPSGAVVTYTATASDIDPASPTVTCVPPSDSTFPVGDNTINCSATDTAGNTTNGTFHIIVQDTVAPVITPPIDQSVEATGLSTSPTLVPATAIDTIDPSPTIDYLPKSFPLGVTPVVWTATDDSGNVSTTTSNVTIVDTTAPVVGTASNVNIGSVSPTTIVTYTDPTATDTVDGSVSVTCAPPSGSTFPIGNTTVTCSATDSHGNTGSSAFQVIVSDTGAPTLTLPGNITNEVTDSAGAVVSFETSAIDDVDGSVAVTCVPPSGSVFPLGVTTVNCSAQDMAETPNVANGSFTVTIKDTQSPVITLNGDNPTNIKVGDTCTEAGAVVTDNYDTGLTATIDSSAVNTGIASTYPVIYTATDSSGNGATSTRNVIVRNLGTDATLSTLSTSLGELSPIFDPNTLTYTVTLPYGTTATPETFATATDQFAKSIGIIPAIDVTSATTSDRTTTVKVTAENNDNTLTYSIVFNVSADVISPIITILGDNPASVTVGDTYADAGATATDNIDGDISANIASTTDVNTSMTGSYKVIYTVNDKAGNKASSTRTVNVIARQTQSNDDAIIGRSGGGGGGVIITTASPQTGTTTSSSQISAEDLILILSLIKDSENNGALQNEQAPNIVPVVNLDTGEVSTTTGTTTANSTSTENNLPLAAAVGTANGFNFNWLWYPVIIVILGGVVFYLYKRKV